MDNRLTLNEVAGLLAEKTGRKKKDCEQFLREFTSVVTEGAFTDRIAKVSGLGTFKIVEVEDRESIHVNTGERFLIPGHFKFNYLPDRELKELVNKPFSFFDTTEINDGVDIQELEATPQEEEEIFASVIEEDLSPQPEEPENTVLPVEEQEITVKELPAEEEKEEAVIDIAEPALEEIPEQVQTTTNETTPEPPQKGAAKISWITFLVSAIVILAGVFTYLYLTPSDVSESPAVSQLSEPAPEPLVEEEVIAAITQEDTGSESTEAEQPDVIARIKIKPGNLLTVIALEHYGSKVFWVYIYDYNKELIKNPNNVPIGTELAIPAPRLYGIDVNDPTSVEKASALQTKIINSQKSASSAN